jgi:probable 2-oxoglutarate dehydrogenase E1 component DHKTD1
MDTASLAASSCQTVRPAPYLAICADSDRLHRTDSPAQLENRTKNAPLLRYVDSLRAHGHRAARIDPLDILQREEVAALNPARYGLTDPAQTYNIDGIVWTRPVGADAPPEEWTLQQITRHLRRIYVGRIAYEYMHSPSKTERLWFSHLLESQVAPAPLGDAERLRIHRLLAESEVFDQFLQAKFPNIKRYALEGGESMLPAMDALFRCASEGMLRIVQRPCRLTINITRSWHNKRYHRHGASWAAQPTHRSAGVHSARALQQVPGRRRDPEGVG